MTEKLPPEIEERLRLALMDPPDEHTLEYLRLNTIEAMRIAREEERETDQHRGQLILLAQELEHILACSIREFERRAAAAKRIAELETAVGQLRREMKGSQWAKPWSSVIGAAPDLPDPHEDEDG